MGDHVESPFDDPVALQRIDRVSAEQRRRPVHGDPRVLLDAGPRATNEPAVAPY
jgi:hypothetical protein